MSSSSQFLHSPSYHYEACKPLPLFHKDEETGSGRLGNFPTVTQLVGGRATSGYPVPSPELLLLIILCIACLWKIPLFSWKLRRLKELLTADWAREYEYEKIYEMRKSYQHLLKAHHAPDILHFSRVSNWQLQSKEI